MKLRKMIIMIFIFSYCSISDFLEINTNALFKILINLMSFEKLKEC